MGAVDLLDDFTVFQHGLDEAPGGDGPGVLHAPRQHDLGKVYLRGLASQHAIIQGGIATAFLKRTLDVPQEGHPTTRNRGVGGSLLDAFLARICSPLALRASGRRIAMGQIVGPELSRGQQTLRHLLFPVFIERVASLSHLDKGRLGNV